MAYYIEKPRAEQFDTMNTLLASIASNTGAGGITLNNWGDVQRLTRMGLASEMFTVGDQFIAEYNNTPYVLDIIGIDHDIPTDKRFKHSLTVQFHDCIMNCQFDNYEALYYAEVPLSAGTHTFTLNNIRYQFTTTKTVPEGGQVFIKSWGSDTYVPSIISTYDADRTTVVESGLSVTEIGSGSDTLTPVNHHQRCRYGSNNYIESNMRQFLNSENSSFVWQPQTIYDRPSTASPYSGAGFLYNLDPELSAVIGEVDKQVARNNVTDGGGQDLLSDKMFLLSRVEIYGGTEDDSSGETAYDYYSALAPSPTTEALDGRIKYLNNSERYWWLRSPRVGSASHTRRVNMPGHVYYYYASFASGLAPACCII